MDNEVAKSIAEDRMNYLIQRIKDPLSEAERLMNLKALKDKQLEYQIKGFGEPPGLIYTKELDEIELEPEVTPRQSFNDVNNPERKKAFDAMKARYKSKSVWDRLKRKIEGDAPKWDLIENNPSLDASYFDSKYNEERKR